MVMDSCKSAFLYITVPAFILVLLPGLFAFGTREKPRESIPVTVTGVLRLTGNEPFTRLVLSSRDGKDYVLEGVDRTAFLPHMGREIVLSGFLRTVQVKTADGRLLADELVLDRVRLDKTFQR